MYHYLPAYVSLFRHTIEKIGKFYILILNKIIQYDTSFKRFDMLLKIYMTFLTVYACSVISTAHTCIYALL